MIFRFRKKKRTLVLRPFGKVYDLRALYNEINEQYFGAKLDLKISWFGRGEQVPKTRITFGSYTPASKLIKINRLLDLESVPKNFVRYIIYHEMLHHVFPPMRKKKGRHHIHHAEFKLKEREFLHYEEAKQFIQIWKKVFFPPQGKEPGDLSALQTEMSQSALS